MKWRRTKEMECELGLCIKRRKRLYDVRQHVMQPAVLLAILSPRMMP